MRLLKDRSGAGVLEYGLIVGLIAMVAIAALLMLGGNSNSSLNHSMSAFPDSGRPGISTSP